MLRTAARYLRPPMRFATDRRGVMFMEFALVAPVLVLLILGSYDYGRYVLVHQKVQRTSTTIADLVARESPLTNSDMPGIFDASGHVMAPFSLSSDGVILVSVIQDDGGNLRIVKQYNGGGTLSATSRVGAEGTLPTLPTGMTVSGANVLVVAEVFYSFDALFLPDWSIGNSIYQATYFRPRGNPVGYFTPPGT